VYTVRWRVTGADGDLVESTFRFAVGAAITSADTASAQGSGAGTSWPSTVWRWLLFAGLALALGGAVGGRLSNSARALRPSLPALRGFEPAGAVAGMAGMVALAITLTVDAGAGALLSSTPGRVVVVETAAFAACLALLRLRPGWAWLPLLAYRSPKAYAGMCSRHSRAGVRC
jgi:copper transport protein